MAKIRLTSPTFVAASKTVTHASFSDVTLAGIQMIVNVTDNIVIYNFADPTKGGTLSTDTLTLDYDTTTMSDTDELMILVEDAINTQAVSAASLPLPTGASTSAKQDTIIGHVDGIEGLLTTIDADTGEISAHIGTLSDVATTVGGTGSLSAKLRLQTTQLDAIQTAVQTLDNAIAGNEMQVDVLTMPTVTVNSHAVTNAGTFATQVDGAALTALQLIDDTVFADDAAVTLGTSKGNVMAGVAVAMDGTDPTAVSAEGDAAALRTDPNRILLVNQTHPRFWHVSADYASAQTNTSVKAAPGASLSLYITDISISNGATAGNITLLDGSGGTVLYEIYPAVNGGATLSLRNPIKLTANMACCITSSTVTTHSVFLSGYIAA